MAIDFSSRSHPFPTADLMVITPRNEVLLVKRKNPPPGWSLPGGFIEYGESAELAAQRELLEETGIHLRLNQIQQFHTYSRPDRDPRFHTVTIVFWAKLPKSFSQRPAAGDDAAVAAWYPIRHLPRMMAFDHRKIVADFLKSGLLF